MHAPADPGTGLWALPGIDQALRALYRDNLSYLEISKQLTLQFDCTVSRNAVAGRVHRLRLPKRNTLGTRVTHARPASIKPRKTRKPASLLQEVPVMTVEPDTIPLEPDPPPGPLTIPGLEWRHCRWPVSGEREHTEFCGSARYGSSPYCPEHHQRAYTSPRIKWT